MRIALPVFEGRVSSVFDWAERLLIVDADGRTSERREVDIGGLSPLSRVRRLRELGVAKLLCGGISAPLIGLVEQQGIEVVAGLVGGVDEIIAALATDELGNPAFSMPGWKCCGRRGRQRRRGHRRGCRGRRS